MRCIFLFLATWICSIAAIAQPLNPIDLDIPMRDGKTLAADLYLPDSSGTYPTILIQTPYNKNFFRTSGLPLGVIKDLDSSKYAFVIVDWRCFWGSLNACKLNPNRGEDGYDVVEWIATQNWSDGKIGTWGPSALGNIQFSTAKEQPPHLVCAAPLVASPRFNYQKYFPGGAARTEYIETLGVLFGFEQIVANNPYENLVWQIADNSTVYPDEIAIPMFLIAGWYDHNTDEDIFHFDTLRKASPIAVRDKHKILIGPWVHGGTGMSAVGTEMQGELSFPEAAGWQDTLAQDFFDFYLRNIQNGWEERPPVQYFQMGDREWKSAETWPPEEAEYQSFYLHEDLSLQSEIPVGVDQDLNFEYDPTDPSPTVGGKTLNLGLDQGPYDQRAEVENRNDALVFSTPILTEDLVVKGKMQVDLFISSEQLDTDFAVRITDVYPDGRSMLQGEGIFRMRFRNGFEESDTAFMNSGTIYPIEISIDHLALTFKAGHRLRLIITSSNYPRFNRNMNTGEEMYPNGNLDTLLNPIIAKNYIKVNESFPSRILVPVVSSTSTAIDESIDDFHIKVYPNPSEGIFYLPKLQPKSKLSIYDSVGNLLIKQIAKESETEIDLSSYPRGIYVLVLEENNIRKTKKLILTK